MGGINLCFVYGSGERRIVPRAHRHVAARITATRCHARHDLATPRGGQDLYDELGSRQRLGELTEVFACGPPPSYAVARSRGRGNWTVGTVSRPITMQLLKALLDVQTGHGPDPNGLDVTSSSDRHQLRFRHEQGILLLWWRRAFAFAPW